MDPTTLIPQPDTITVPWGWFQLLLIVTFVLHLLFMNTMLGSSIIALVRELKTGIQNGEANQDIASKLPYTVAFTVNIGVAPLLFLQVLYGTFMYTSSVLMAVYWLSIVGLAIIAYYCVYIYDFKFQELGKGRTIFIAIAVIILLVVGFIFTNNMILMLKPALWTRYFSNPSGTLLNLREPMLLPRYLHFITASIAVGGLFQAVRWQIRPGTDKNSTRKHIHDGLRWFSNATIIQMAIGFWFLVALPRDKMMLFLGDSILPTVLLFIGLMGAIIALVMAMRGRVWPTTGAAICTIVVMVLMRDALRAAYLSPYFAPASLKVVPEYSPMILFLISFAIGLALVFYMLKLAADAGKEMSR